MARTIYFLSLLFLMMPLLCNADDSGGDISLEFTLQSYKVVEDNGPAQPVLRLSKAVDCCSTISVWVHVQELDAKQQTNPGEGGTKEVHDFLSESYVQVLFPGGLTTAKFDVHLVHDVILEHNETFRISIDPLSLPHGVILGTVSSATVTILDDDNAEVSFIEPAYTIEERHRALDVTLSLSKFVPFTDHSLTLEINDGTTTPVDYESKLHTVPIPNNRTLFHYTVMINDDDLFELDEVFTLEIKNSTHPKVMVGERATTTITVISEEHPINVTLTTTPTIDETAGVLKVNLTLDKPSPCCFRVYVKTVDKLAQGDGVDHGEQNDEGEYEVIFPAGTDCSSIEIPIIDDDFSEQDEEFTIEIMEESLPFGIHLGENTATDVKIIDNDIYLMFSSEDYKIYEHKGMVCVTVTHDKPALFNTFVQLVETRGTATSGSDYEAGPYNVTIPKGERSANYCINITNDEYLEVPDEAFVIEINVNKLHPDVVLMQPMETRVTIMDDEYTLCFDKAHYTIKEDEGPLVMTLTLSKPLPFNITVKFLYEDRRATGNHSANAGIKPIDYYTSIAFPIFDTIPAYSNNYTLNVTIVSNRFLEDNKLFDVTVKPEHMPIGQPDCKVAVIIEDDDDIMLNFERRSYGVHNKNKAKARNSPVIRITYPEGNISSIMFPIVVQVNITNITAKENEDFQKQNYSFKIIQDTIVTQKLLNVYPIDDNVVEINEIYNLTIELMDTTHDRVLTGENQTTTITLYDDDISFVRTDGNLLRFTKPLQLPSNAVVNVLYIDGQYNMTITAKEALTKTDYELPRGGIEEVYLHFPAEFTRPPPNETVQPADGFNRTIYVYFDL